MISAVICPWTLIVLRSSQFSSSFGLRRPGGFSEQIISAGKYWSTFSRQIEAVLYLKLAFLTELTAGIARASDISRGRRAANFK